MQANHIAVLVRSLAAVSDSLPPFCKRHGIEEQPTEGTKEQYIEIDGKDAVMLLLVQPFADGPYARALAKRGPGLHHIGCVTPSIREEMQRIRACRLLLHPISLGTHAAGVIWLCRPGVPFLVELMQTPNPGPGIVGGSLRLPSDVPVPEYTRAIAENLDLSNSGDRRIDLSIGKRSLSLDPTLD